MRDDAYPRQILHVPRPTQAAQNLSSQLRAPGQFTVYQLSTSDGPGDSERLRMMAASQSSLHLLLVYMSPSPSQTMEEFPSVDKNEYRNEERFYSRRIHIVTKNGSTAASCWSRSEYTYRIIRISYVIKESKSGPIPVFFFAHSVSLFLRFSIFLFFFAIL